MVFAIRFKGSQFSRQHLLGPYLVELYCAERRSIVEPDGSVHAQASQAGRDARRGAHLKKMGYVVLRFSKGMVEEAPELLVQQIWDAVWSLPEALG